MNMIPFHSIERPNYLVIQFQNYKNILMMENYCSDPDCDCHIVTLNFVQLNQDHKITNNLLNIKVDLTNDNILESEVLEETVNADDLLYEFHLHFNQFKSHLVENNLKVKKYYSTYHGDELPKEILELIKDKNCVEYSEIFSNVNRFVINYHDEEYLIDDQYCMNPSCSCNDAILVVYKPNALESDFVIRLNLETNKHDLLKFNGSKDYNGLIKHIIESKMTSLKARYNRMKEVGKHFLAPKETEKSKPKLTLKKVGRNELCPCGSGKKYKKCCGNIN